MQPSNRIVFISLLVVRIFSASFNIIHDCDEVYNYWEPLHRILYGFGKQVWEYSPEYALRSYLYILIHAIIVAPLAWLLGPYKNKVYVFYALRCAFALQSAYLESKLHKL